MLIAALLTLNSDEYYHPAEALNAFCDVLISIYIYIYLYIYLYIYIYIHIGMPSGNKEHLIPLSSAISQLFWGYT